MRTNSPSSSFQRASLETLFGNDIWDNIKGKTIIDFGSGFGADGIWDLGEALSSVTVLPLIDHGPFPQEGIGATTQASALIKGARNPEAGRKLIDWATSPAMQNLFVKYKINLIPVHPDTRIDPGLAKLLEEANIFPLDMEFRANNRERIVDRWVKEVLP